MNATIRPAQPPEGPIRELQQLLARGQARSHAALIDIATAKVATPPSARNATSLPPTLIANFARQIFAPQYVIPSTLADCRKTINEMGGVQTVAILMRDHDLFFALLPKSSRVISLVIKHHHTNSAAASDSVLRGRQIRTKLDPSAKSHAVAEIEKQTEHSYSIWNALIQALAARFGKSHASDAVPPGLLVDALSSDDRVLAGDLYDLKKGTHLSRYRAEKSSVPETDVPVVIGVLREMFDGNLDLRRVLAPLASTIGGLGKVQVQIGNLDFYWLRIPYYPALHLPFDPTQVLLLYKEPRAFPTLDWTALDRTGLNLLRLRISNLLDSGMRTTVDPFPETQVEFQALLDELGGIDPDDLESRLDIGGFLAHPRTIADIEQRCQECIYYLPNRQWCDLPELPVPVKPDWWCRLWKI